MCSAPEIQLNSNPIYTNKKKKKRLPNNTWNNIFTLPPSCWFFFAGNHKMSQSPLLPGEKETLFLHKVFFFFQLFSRIQISPNAYLVLPTLDNKANLSWSGVYNRLSILTVACWIIKSFTTDTLAW